jgi:glycogen(starch) synthase
VEAVGAQSGHRLRILMLSWEYPPVVVGGLGRHVHALATNLAAAGHAHDWLVTHTAMTMREHLDVPLVTTLHATEAGRHQGWLPEDLNRTIHGVEWWLAHESDQLIACSEYMRWEISRLLDVPAGGIAVIPNGVHAPAWQPSARAVVAARARYAGDGPLLGFAGRLVYEKGVQYLIDALPRLRRDHPGLRLIIAGDGPYRPDLHAHVDRLGLAETIRFTGFLGDHLPALFATTDSVVVPSVYEPFGMVALEAAASGAPVAVSATGGLAEIVDHGVTGVTFPARDPDGLADAVATLLADRSEARRLARSARHMVHTRYGWAGIAARTAVTYRAAVDTTPARPAAQRHLTPPAPTVPAGRNLLTATAR